VQIPQSNPVGRDFWETQSVHDELSAGGESENLRATERELEKAVWLPEPKRWVDARDELDRPLRQLVGRALEEEAKRKRQSLFVLQYDESGRCLMANDGRLGRRWRFVDSPMNADSLKLHLEALCAGKSAVIMPHGPITAMCRELVQAHGGHAWQAPSGDTITLALTAYRDPEVFASYPERFAAPSEEMTHLDRLEAESIHIMREVAAQAENPVMLYSVGKDSSVMLHLARKAFYPSPPPFPLMHVDTRWKFRAMYDFRDRMADEVGMELIVHINPEGVEKDINPFDHGSALHTDVMKTQGLKQALDKHGFDVAFGGARRDEEKSRAKERVFSFRTSTHRWDPKNQRPELWNLYNGYKKPGESIRVFPLSNWTELDIWQYIYRENIPIVPLYFAAERPVVERDGMLMMVDDDRMRLLPGEKIETRRIRFRTLGCYPLTGAIDSEADSLSSIVLELLKSRTSERQGRAIDSDSAGSMEKKKQEGYF
jgi:sulfate adenylyltransferase subunit 2